VQREPTPDPLQGEFWSEWDWNRTNSVLLFGRKVSKYILIQKVFIKQLPFCVAFFLFFNVRSYYVAQAGLEFAVSCLCLLNTGITGVYHHRWLLIAFYGHINNSKYSSIAVTSWLLTLGLYC
jgi:hypothetical protein